jgi:3-oxoadipate enol-lactonase
VLLHGWLATADLNWFASYEALGHRFRVVTIDHRGHGRGIRSSRAVRLADCADDVAALADALEIPSFIAVGYSMGGPIAQLTWHRHRDRVDGLVLCATSRNFAGRPIERAAFGAIASAAVAARATPAPVQQRVGRRMAQRRHEAETPASLWAREQFQRSDFRALLEAGRSLGRFSSHEWIGEVDVPTAVVVTEHDELVLPHRQQALAEAIPGSTIHPVAGDHLCCSEEPELFVPVLLEACGTVADRIDRTLSSDPVAGDRKR